VHPNKNDRDGCKQGQKTLKWKKWRLMGIWAAWWGGHRGMRKKHRSVG